MKSVKYTIGHNTFNFSIEQVKKYKKEDFFKMYFDAFPKIEKSKLKDVLNEVWKEAFPAKDNAID